MMIEDFLFQIAVVALIIAMWADVARLHRRLRRLEELMAYTYYAAYYVYHQTAVKERGSDEEAAAAGEEADADEVKTSCVLELISRRGCVGIEEVVELCGVSKSFVLNKLYRKMKVVRVDKEGRVCPR
jgi:Ca2+/Na+ antiporter